MYNSVNLLLLTAALMLAGYPASADLTFTPADPAAAPGQRIEISISGAELSGAGELSWPPYSKRQRAKYQAS